MQGVRRSINKTRVNVLSVLTVFTRCKLKMSIQISHSAMSPSKARVQVVQSSLHSL